jgi:hypothetical protein
MAVNFSNQILAQAQSTFGRSVVFTPLTSQPTGAPYIARGILEQESIDVGGLDGSIISEMRIILDIRDVEFAVLPLKGDLVDIPEDVSGVPAEGQFEVLDLDQNGGGETTLTLRRIVQAKP